mmetsp:Transcript_6853/g.18339  ORF Transcript_6853/g.18339 Transcript_6853/m.18339 type:complete len:454 (+) Transcript_6853:44-1405(+)
MEAAAAGEGHAAGDIAAGREQGGVLQNVMVGAGFLADAYDLFVVGMVIQVLRLERSDAWVVRFGAPVSYAAIVGALMGQLTFGHLADRFGRRPMFMLTSALTLLGALLSAAAVNTPSPTAFAAQLIVFRFCLGCGIGGEYPLSATVSHELADKSGKPAERAVLAVFCLQGLGFLLCAAVVWTLVSLRLPTAMIWRISLFVGALPSSLALVLRCIMLDETREEQNAGSLSEHSDSSSTEGYRTILLGTAASWFLLDVTFYGNALVQSAVLEASNAGSSLSDHARNALWNAALALPGYALAYVLGMRVGMWTLQWTGFLLLASLFVALAVSWRRIGPSLCLALYGLSFLVSNLPNCTTFVTAASAFPTSIRASCHGLSAAAGKAGALAGIAALTALSRRASASAVYLTCAAAALAGAVTTLLLVPPRPAHMHTTISMQPPTLSSTVSPCDQYENA